MIENRYDQIRAAMREANETMRAADSVAESMAQIIQGRLRKVPPYLLKKLKREISQFNCNTGRWKEDGK